MLEIEESKPSTVKTENGATPGPWTVSEGRVPGYERTISVVDKTDLGICGLFGAGSRNPKVLNYVRANARLIAAAPRMFDYIHRKANQGDSAAAEIIALIEKEK